MDTLKIIKVKQKGKKYLVYITEDETPVEFTEDGLVQFRIVKDAEFDLETWKQIQNGKKATLLFDQTLHFLDYKPRTTFEIKEYLRKKEADEDTIHEIIERLLSIQYLDDDRYAKQYIEEGIRNRKGPTILSFQLEQLGIDMTISAPYLNLYSSSLQYENAKVIATKYQQLNAKYPMKKQRELIYQKLIRSGYSYEVINQVLNTLDYGTDSVEELKKQYEKLSTKTKDKNKIITALMSKGYQYEDIKKIIKK